MLIPTTESEVKTPNKTVSRLYVTILEQVLVAQGYEIRVQDKTIKQLIDAKGFLSPKEFFTVVDHLLPRPCVNLGFDYGQSLNLVAAEAIGQLVMSSASLEQLFYIIRQYRKLLGYDFALELEHNDSLAWVKLGPIFTAETPLIYRRFMSEAVYTCVLNQARWLTGEKLNYRYLSFPYSAPPCLQRYHEQFNCELRFDQEQLELELAFDRDYLSCKLITANPKIAEIKQQQCESILNKVDGNRDLVSQIADILEQVSPKVPTIESVAQHLNTSKSSLHRHLQKYQMTYQCIVDRYHQRQAEQLLLNTRKTVSEIAEQLGFSDSSSFRRSFKRWTGQCPSSLRESVEFD